MPPLKPVLSSFAYSSPPPGHREDRREKYRKQYREKHHEKYREKHHASLGLVGHP
ncbi:MAG: hypothetical protein VKI82_05980 [Leptolyngbya sp.]|nr:hypothetical protein [Leptolyngbya sp.]